jgi:hypothetical protein
VKPRQLSRLRGGDEQAVLLSKLLEIEEAFGQVVRWEDGNLDGLARKIPRHRWVRVPYLEQEAVDFPGLVAITEQLLAG